MLFFRLITLVFSVLGVGCIVVATSVTMDFIIKFAQAHETFRIPEIEALAVVENVPLEIVHYDEAVRDPIRHR